MGHNLDLWFGTNILCSGNNNQAGKCRQHLRWSAERYSSLNEVKAVEFTSAETLVQYDVTSLGYGASVLQLKEALVPQVDLH